MPRALHLFLLSVKYALHKLRYDLAREIVVAFCSLVLAGLFYHISNDFLNRELASLSQMLRQSFGNSLGIVLACTTSLALGQQIRRERRDPLGFAAAAFALGEDPAVITRYWLWRLSFLCLLFLGPGLGFAQAVFLRWPWSSWLILSPFLLLGVTIAALATPRLPFKRASGSSRKILRPLLQDHDYPSPLRTMIVWRCQQMLRRNRFPQAAFIISGLLTLGLAIALIRGLPPLLAALWGLLASLCVASGFILEISYDIAYGWVEKNLGVSHDLYLRCLEWVGLLLGSSLGLLLASIYAITLAFSSSGITLQGLTEAMTLGFIGLQGPFLVPYLAFQIDARKAGVQLMSLILISLFVATALYASPAAIVLFPVIAYYGRSSQARRFYRS